MRRSHQSTKLEESTITIPEEIILWCETMYILGGGDDVSRFDFII
jgi:hypothetical protein